MYSRNPTNLRTIDPVATTFRRLKSWAITQLPLLLDAHLRRQRRYLEKCWQAKYRE